MTRERDAAAATITALNTSLTERTRERDVATTTITALNTSLTERTRERDNLRQIFADESRRPVLESSRLQEVRLS